MTFKLGKMRIVIVFNHHFGRTASQNSNNWAQAEKLKINSFRKSPLVNIEAN